MKKGLMYTILTAGLVIDVENMKQKLWYLFISIFLNTLGSSIIVIANVGVSPYSAAGLNMEAVFPISLGTALLLTSIILQIVTVIVERNIPLRRIIFDFVFMFCYSYGVDFWLYLFKGMEINSVFMNYIIFVLGMFIVAVAVSIYLQLNLVLHPIDLFFKMLKDRLFHGNVVKAQLLNYGIPIVISVILGLLNHDILALSVGTFIYFLFFGKILDIVDKRMKFRMKNIANVEQIISIKI